MNLGVDIEEIKRIQKLVRNKQFLNRVFSKEEIAYCQKKKNSAQHYAVRFAAKEAVWKAMSDILEKKKKNLSHRDIAIKNTTSGKPHVFLPKPLNHLGKKLAVSLSHSRNYAVAVAFYKG